jgi:predicted RNase H-like HicB family nuclease
MSSQKPTLLEHLRHAAKQGLMLRDRLLELAEDLPSPDRERVQQTASKLITFGTKLREIAETLPTDPDVDVLEVVDDPDELRAQIEGALEVYFESALDDLQELIDEREERERQEEQEAKAAKKPK